MRQHWAICRFVFLLLITVSAVWAAPQEQREPHEPSFSMDAAQIVFTEHVTPVGEVLPTTYEIWTMFIDGTGARRLTQGFKDTKPRFSPDSKQIVFVRDLQLWLINADGSNLHRVSDTKAAFINGAEFSNDGKSLFFIRPAPLEISAKELAKEPLLILGVGDVLVQFDLATGKERVIVNQDYGVRQVVPHPNDDNAVFVLCNELDNGGKPRILGNQVIAVAHLQGAQKPAVVFAPDKDHSLKDFRMSPTTNAVNATAKGKFGDSIFLIENGGLKPIEKLLFLGDISFDGNTLLGMALNDKIRFQIAIYDIDTQKLTYLKKKEN